MGLRPKDCGCADWPFSHEEGCAAILRRQLWKMYERIFADRMARPTGSSNDRALPEEHFAAAMDELHEASVAADIKYMRKQGKKVRIAGYADGTQYLDEERSMSKPGNLSTTDAHYIQFTQFVNEHAVGVCRTCYTVILSILARNEPRLAFDIAHHNHAACPIHSM